MIFVFHSLYFLLRDLLRAYNKSKAIDDFHKQNFFHGSEVNFHNSCCIEEGNVLFDPPIYRLRYAAVQQVLLHESLRTHITKVVDFGCGEFHLFQYLKRLYGVRDILCVDVDEILLTEHLSQVHPLTVDYLKRRNAPLHVQVLCGSAGDPDFRLKGTDAIICVEIIEHLYPDVLEALPYNIFHFIRPLVAVFTTPNADFNVLFRHPDRFRHADHKFEWTREQFQDWADNVAVRFPKYTVKFEGIGHGPSGTDHLGRCTQMAMFVRDVHDEQLCEVPRSCREIKDSSGDTEELNMSCGICTHFSYTRQINRYDERLRDDENSTGAYYKLIEEIEYPYEVDDRSTEEKISDEVIYKVHKYTSVNSRFYNEEVNKIQLPLRELVSNEEGYYTTVSEVKKLLEKKNYQIEECNLFGSGEPVLCVVYDPDMDNRSASPENESNSSEERNDLKISYVSNDETDWDLDQVESYAWKLNLEARQDEPDHRVTESSKSSFEEARNISEPKLADDLQQSELKYCNLHVGVVGATNSVHDDSHVLLQHNEKDLVSTKKDGGAKSGQNKTHSANGSLGNKHVAKKGTNIKNSARAASQGSSKETTVSKPAPKRSPVNSAERDVSSKRAPKKSCDAKIKESTHSLAQGPSSPKATSNHKSPSSEMKSHQKIDESMPGTSEIKKKPKKAETDVDKEDIKNLAECILYNSLNKVQEIDEEQVIRNVEMEQERPEEEPAVENGDLANNNRDVEGNNYPNEEQFVEGPNEDKVNDNVEVDAEEGVRNQDFQNRNNDDVEPYAPEDRENLALGQELNHASREALFDPNSEVDMLEEFEIPPPPTARPTDASILESHNVILIRINQTEEDNVVLPENADPFPSWLLQLLGANVEEGESHDEPHFYCQGDGIGVHPSIVEVEIDEEQSTESSSSNDEAEAEHTISEPGIGPLPSDELDGESLQTSNENFEVAGTVLVPNRVQAQNVSSPGSNSTADSGDEFFDTVDETLLLDEASPRPNVQD